MKKLLLFATNLMLSGSLLLSGLNTTIPIAAKEESDKIEETDPNAWDGKPSQSWDEKTITSPQDLAAFAEAVNSGESFAGKTIKLMADLNLNNLNWTPIGNKDNPFAGIFEGNGKTISNLSIDVPETEEGKTAPFNSGKRDYAGLFGCVKSAEEESACIKNLTLENVILYGINYTGALIGEASEAVLENIELKGSIKIVGSKYVGGLIGSFSGVGTNLSIPADQSLTYNSVTAINGYVGGLAGICRSGSQRTRLENCLSALDDVVISSSSSTPNANYAGGIVGFLEPNTDLVNCKNEGPVHRYGDGIGTMFSAGGLAGGWGYQPGSITHVSGMSSGRLWGALTGLSSAEKKCYDKYSLLGIPSLSGEDNQNGPDKTNFGGLYLGADQNSLTRQAAYFGNSYFSHIEEAVQACPDTGTIELLSDISKVDEAEQIVLSKGLNIQANGFSTEGIAIDSEVSTYVFYSDNGTLSASNSTGVCDIVTKQDAFAHITGIEITPDFTRARPKQTIPVKATLIYEPNKPIPTTPVKLWWRNDAVTVWFEPNAPEGLEANIYSEYEGTYTIWAQLDEASAQLAVGKPISNQITVTYSKPTIPPSPRPSTDSSTDKSEDVEESKPESGINAGISGEGAGFTESGSQTLVMEDGQKMTFNQSEDGSKTASALDHEGKVSSSTITLSETALQSEKVRIDLGQDEGKALAVSGEYADKNSAPVLTINLPEKESAIEVLIPIEEGTLTAGTIAMIEDENGNLKPILKSSYNSEEGMLSVPLSGSSKIVIVNNAVEFKDAQKAPEYAQEAAAYVSARELMTGMGESTPKPFEFDGLTSRGQFATILYRLSGKPATSGAYPDGVTPGLWNAEAARWAVNNGYMAQGGSRFNPGQEITRDQIITILYRMNEAPKANLSLLNKYSDANYISNEDFKNAMAWGIEKGIIGQGVTTLRPQSEASRAEIAAMMERIIQNLY